MDLKQLEKETRQEMVEEKKDLAKGVLKSRIREIEKTERVLAKLKQQYEELLTKSVDDIAEESENGNIPF